MLPSTFHSLKEIFLVLDTVSLRESETIERELGWTPDKTLYGDLWVDLFPLLASWASWEKMCSSVSRNFPLTMCAHTKQTMLLTLAAGPCALSLGRAWQPVGETRRQRYELCNCMLSRHPFFVLHYFFDE